MSIKPNYPGKNADLALAAMNAASAASAGYMPKTKRETALELALMKLCVCKQFKDKHGKTELYERNKDQAWAEAFKLLGI